MSDITPIQLFNDKWEKILPDYSFFESVQEQFIKSAVHKYNEHITKYLLTNLGQLGFKFENDSEFIDFLSKRVTKIGFQDRPNEYELYVDFQTDNQKLIGLYNDTVSISYDEGKYTATFGLLTKNL